MDNESNVVELKQPTYMFGEIDDTVNIPRGEYEDLLEDASFLRFLEDAGVDNWIGYNEALRLYNEENQVEG